MASRMTTGVSPRPGSGLNGANLRVIWDDLVRGFPVARAMANLDHFMTRHIEQLMWLRSSFDRPGFTPEGPDWNMVFGDHLNEIRDKPFPHLD